MTSGVSSQKWITQFAANALCPAKCLMCLRLHAGPHRISPLRIQLTVPPELLGARNIWGLKLQPDIPNPSQIMRPCGSVLCVGRGSWSCKDGMSSTDPRGSPAPQRLSSLQGHLSKGVSGWDLLSLSEFVPGLKTQTVTFLSTDSSRYCSGS